MGLGAWGLGHVAGTAEGVMLFLLSKIKHQASTLRA